MRLVEDLGKLKPQYRIITGDGRTEVRIFRTLPEKYNGDNLILFFPFPSRSRKTGLSALNILKDSKNIRPYSIIYIVDGDTFEDKAPNTKIQEYLKSIGINILSINSIQDAFLIECKSDNQKLKLYCIISGPQTFIEEEIVKLIELKLGKKIDLSGIRDSNWKKRVKREVKQTLREKKIKLEVLIKNTGISKLEASFPNICVVLKKIEEEYK